MTRVLVTLGFLLALASASTAQASHKVIFGINDAGLTTPRSLALAAPLHLDQVAITLNWSPASVITRTELGAIPGNQPVLLILQGARDDSPSSPFARAKFCEYASGLAWAHPNIREIQVWNEPILSQSFWKGSTSDYLKLLATCYDALHGRVKILAPGSHPNLGAQFAFVRGVQSFYRATHRKRPLFDAYSVHPYWDWSTKAVAHAMDVRWKHLPQRSPKRGLRFWWTETGMESDTSGMPLVGYRRGYSGTAINWRLQGTAAQQATRVGMIARLAKRNPLVVADFNFLLFDEIDLSRWQSGLLYMDGTPKPAYFAFKAVIHPT